MNTIRNALVAAIVLATAASSSRAADVPQSTVRGGLPDA
jgi:hypothetical protein